MSASTAVIPRPNLRRNTITAGSHSYSCVRSGSTASPAPVHNVDRSSATTPSNGIAHASALREARLVNARTGTEFLSGALKRGPLLLFPDHIGILLRSPLEQFDERESA